MRVALFKSHHQVTGFQVAMHPPLPSLSPVPRASDTAQAAVSMQEVSAIGHCPTGHLAGKVINPVECWLAWKPLARRCSCLCIDGGVVYCLIQLPSALLPSTVPVSRPAGTRMGWCIRPGLVHRGGGGEGGGAGLKREVSHHYW